MNDDSGFSQSNILVSFVVGGLTGAAIALLLAPQTGEKTRAEIKDGIRDGVERGRKAGGRIASKAPEALERASNYIGKHATHRGDTPGQA